MRNLYSLLLILSANTLMGQTAESKMVPVRINYSKSNTPQASLQWPYNAAATSIGVWRKTISQNTWQILKSGMTATDTIYTDTAFKMGVFYEYMVVQVVSGVNIYGTVAAGLELPPSRQRKECLIVSDSALYIRIKKEVDSFKQLIALDGWRVELIFSKPTQTPPDVKAAIVAWSNKSSFLAEKSVVLIGKVPIPYSGNIAPDAHPDHIGAWPADCYYADLNNSTWNDISVTNPGTTSRQENKNIPGDGKFDESALPDLVDGQVGRIYLDSLSNMGVSADSLYKRYFNKVFKYRTKSIVIPRKACIEDRLYALGGEWPGRNVFMNAYALVGKDSTTWAQDSFLRTVKSKSFLFAQVTSTGGYTQVINVATSAQVKDSMNAVFQGYFGSYFGDWDNNNNFLRSSIAGNGNNLTSMWAGRPQWMLHHMTLGKTIGYTTKITQNNINTYYAGASANNVHIALMGDPTLPLHIVAPMKNLQAVSTNNQTEVRLTWAAVDDNIARYYIFKSDSLNGFYSIYDSVDVSKNTYDDTKPAIGKNYYMVRAAKLESTHLGTYYNMGLGLKVSMDSIKAKPSMLTNQSNNPIRCVCDPGQISLMQESSPSMVQSTLINAVGEIMMQTSWQQKLVWQTNYLASGTYFVLHEWQDGSKSIQKILLNNTF